MALSLVGAPIGANVDDVSAGGLNAAGVSVTGLGAKAQLGTVVVDTAGTEYTYVQAGSASSAMASTRAPNAYAIGSDFRARLLTTARAAAGLGLGFAPRAVIVANDYFWARTKPVAITVQVATSASADKYLRTTVTKGLLGTVSTASAVVFPVVVTTAAGASIGVAGVPAYASRLSGLGQTAIANAMAAL